MRSFYIIVFSLLAFFPIKAFNQNYPGGVQEVAIWYKASETDLMNGQFSDYGSSQIDIRSCADEIDPALFNFNPSILSEELCLYYFSPLESLNLQDVFLVSEPTDESKSFSHFSTAFNDFVPTPYIDSISRNKLLLQTKQGYGSGLVGDFNLHQNADVYFYKWYNYEIDKKFKSYGEQGETKYYIGKRLPFPELEGDQSFSGLLPEFLVFNRQLSLNEQNRVNSYLALKYGISLWRTSSYRDAKNKVFWDKQNNKKFRHNIFGIGRDNISGLNQLQSESAHNRDYLVAAIEQIRQTNLELQEHLEIPDRNYTVFGDTGKNGLKEESEQGLNRLKRVWLTQVTGEEISYFPFQFRLDLENEFQPYIDDIETEDLTVWMLHDPYTKNNYVSDFDNGNVNYYKPDNLKIKTDSAYAYFNELNFDKDRNTYDQFTFAVGPDMIVQVRYVKWQCEGDCFDMEIVITGGVPEFEISISPEEDIEIPGSYNPEKSDEENLKFVYDISLCGPQEYTLEVTDANGLIVNKTFTVETKNNSLNLGPDQLFTKTPPILLEAGQGINDPKADYKWFFNEIPFNHNSDTLTVKKPGTYKVIVKTSDQSCQLEDSVNILTAFEADIYAHSQCLESENYLQVMIRNDAPGIPPYTINVQGNGLDFNRIDHQDNITIHDIPYGTYQITVTDSIGDSIQETVTFEDTSSSSGSFGPDQTLTEVQPQITLDAPFGQNSDFRYRWYRDGTLLSDTIPQIIVDLPGEYKVEVVIPETGCDGEASINIDHEMKGEINWDIDCEQDFNSLTILIDYGFPPYETSITGIQYPSGNPYTYTQTHTGDINLSGIPAGDYTVTVSDEYGGTLQKQIEFSNLDVDIDEQLMTLFLDNCDEVQTKEDHCNLGLTAIDCFPPISSFNLDASTLIMGNSDVTYDWTINGQPLSGYHNPNITFIYGGDCDYMDVENYCEGLYITVTITDQETGCSISGTALTYIRWCPVLPSPTSTSGGSSIETKVYPNPSDPDATFYYEISNSEQENINGTVELFSFTGSLIHSVDITGKSRYKLPFSLLASGTYFIKTTTNNTVKVDRVIIK